MKVSVSYQQTEVRVGLFGPAACGLFNVLPDDERVYLTCSVDGEFERGMFAPFEVIVIDVEGLTREELLKAMQIADANEHGVILLGPAEYEPLAPCDECTLVTQDLDKAAQYLDAAIDEAIEKAAFEMDMVAFASALFESKLAELPQQGLKTLAATGVRIIIPVPSGLLIVTVDEKDEPIDFDFGEDEPADAPQEDAPAENDETDKPYDPRGSHDFVD